MKQTRIVDGHKIEIGQQDLEYNVVPVTDENGTKIYSVYSDKDGHTYFVYEGIKVYF